MHSSRRRSRSLPFYRRKAPWIALAALLLAVSAATAGYFFFRVEPLGTITIDNSLDGAQPIEDGYQIAVELPIKEGLKQDFSNLRIFGPNGDPLPFFIDADSLQREGLPLDTARVWIRLPALDLSVMTLTYDGAANESLSDPRAVFDDFDDFANLRTWSVRASAGRVAPVPAARAEWMVTKAFRFGQAIAMTPHGIAMTRHRDPAPSEMILIDPASGETLAGPVDAPVHTIALSYVPEMDYLISAPIAAAADGTVSVFRAKDLSLVGKLRFEPEGSKKDVQVVYKGPGKLLRIAEGRNGLVEYDVDWKTLEVRAGRSYMLPGGRLWLRRMQGFTYRPQDNSFYVNEDRARTLDNGVHRFQLTDDGKLIYANSWRYLPMDPSGAVAEPEGIHADPRDGKLYYAGLGTAQPQGNRPGLPYADMHVYRLTFEGAKGIQIWNPQSSGETVALWHEKPLAGPARVLFAMDGVSAADSLHGAATGAAFGIADALNGTEMAAFRAAPNMAASGVTIDQRAAGAMTRNNIESLSSANGALTAPGIYEIAWNGSTASFVVDGKPIADYSESVPAATAGSKLRAFIASQPPGRRGAILRIRYIAKARAAPAGATPPELIIL